MFLSRLATPSKLAGLSQYWAKGWPSSMRQEVASNEIDLAFACLDVGICLNPMRIEQAAVPGRSLTLTDVAIFAFVPNSAFVSFWCERVPWSLMSKSTGLSELMSAAAIFSCVLRSAARASASQEPPRSLRWMPLMRNSP